MAGRGRVGCRAEWVVFVSGRVEPGVVDVGGFVTLGRFCGASDRWVDDQPAGPGSARRFVSMVVKSSCHGQRVGKRRVWRPARFALTAGTAMMRVRRVRLLTGS